MGNYAQGKKLPDLTDREMLQDLREAAFAYSDEVTDINWRDAFIQMANAADRLDAMVARSTLKR